MMNPRARVLAALERKPADRFPVDLWLTPEVLDDLRRHFGIEDELEVYRALGVDKIVWTFPGYRRERAGPDEPVIRTTWGVPLREVRSGAATYREVAEAPLAGMEDPEELDAYPHWPDPEAFDVSLARERAERARALGFATIGPWVSFFEIYCQLRGMEDALMDVLAEPEFLAAALDRIEAIQTRLLDRYLGELGELADIVFISDDMGTQESQLLSLEAWREHFQPRLVRWCARIHRHGTRVLFHTDGAARPYIPDLIAAGVDILNPIQHVCPGMDREGLKADFGDRLVFHGGIENQRVLPFGNPEDVRAETRACLDTLGAGGGYIPCSCHNIQPGTPVANVLALVETVHQYG